MRYLLLAVFGLNFLGLSSLSAECACKDCKCQSEKHCGCHSGQACQCQLTRQNCCNGESR